MSGWRGNTHNERPPPPPPIHHDAANSPHHASSRERRHRLRHGARKHLRRWERWWQLWMLGCLALDRDPFVRGDGAAFRCCAQFLALRRKAFLHVRLRGRGLGLLRILELVFVVLVIPVLVARLHALPVTAEHLQWRQRRRWRGEAHRWGWWW